MPSFWSVPPTRGCDQAWPDTLIALMCPTYLNSFVQVGLSVLSTLLQTLICQGQPQMPPLPTNGLSVPCLQEPGDIVLFGTNHFNFGEVLEGRPGSGWVRMRNRTAKTATPLPLYKPPCAHDIEFNNEGCATNFPVFESQLFHLGLLLTPLPCHLSMEIIL